MAPPRPWRGGHRTAATAFVLLLVVIPMVLLTGIPPWILATASTAAGLFAFRLRFLLTSERQRAVARSAALALLFAAGILGILQASGALEPLLRREGWLLLDLETRASPREAAPGDAVTYTLSTTNTGARAALGRRFSVDGTSWAGVLVYGRIPELGGGRFALDGHPSARVTDESGASAPCTVIYASPGLPELNPGGWNWSTSCTQEAEIVAAITSDGSAHRSLGVGETLSLEYKIRIPENHPAGRVRSEHASLSYRDPQWATYRTHDLRFALPQLLVVEPPAN